MCRMVGLWLWLSDGMVVNGLRSEDSCRNFFRSDKRLFICWLCVRFKNGFKMGTVLKWIWVCKLLSLSVGLKRVWVNV